MNVKTEARLCLLIYLFLALPAVYIFSIVTPTFHVPDETQHFIRAYQVSNYEFFPTKRKSLTSEGYKVGGMVDKGIKDLNDSITSIAFDPQKKLTTELNSHARELRWRGERWLHTPNVSVYPPFFYIPAAIGISIAKKMDLTIAESVTLSRWCNLVVGCTLASLAIILSGESALVLTFFLLFPMVLSQMASTSQDALLLPTAAFMAALLGKLFNTRSLKETFFFAMLSSVCLVLLATSRPPYTALGVILFFLALRQPQNKGRNMVMAISLGSIAISFLYAYYVSRYVNVPFAGNQADIPVQFKNVMGDVFGFLTVLWVSIGEFGSVWMEQMVGVLGWLDTPLPGWYYDFTFILLFFLLFLYLKEQRIHLFAQDLLWSKTWITTVLLLSFCGLLFVFYLFWSPVGADQIQGIQGRYLLPFFFLSTLLLKSDYCAEGFSIWSKMRFILLCLSATTGISVSIIAVFTRYYI